MCVQIISTMTEEVAQSSLIWSRVTYVYDYMSEAWSHNHYSSTGYQYPYSYQYPYISTCSDCSIHVLHAWSTICIVTKFILFISCY